MCCGKLALWRVGLLACVMLARPLAGEKIRLIQSPTVPGATGEVETGRDNNGNTKIDLKVEHLARPSNLSPPRTTYLVWAQAPGASPEKVGQLNVNNDLKGNLKAVTPLKNFQLLVTAEDDPQTTEPRGPVVLQATVPEHE